VWLAQLVRFLMVKLIHSSSDSKFNIDVLFRANYFFSGRDVPVDNETFLVIDFINLKIKPTQGVFGLAVTMKKSCCGL
jgi:hypothetical protein